MPLTGLENKGNATGIPSEGPPAKRRKTSHALKGRKVESYDSINGQLLCNDLLFFIFSFLQCPKDLRNVRLVCRHWRSLYSNPWFFKMVVKPLLPSGGKGPFLHHAESLCPGVHCKWKTEKNLLSEGEKVTSLALSEAAWFDYDFENGFAVLTNPKNGFCVANPWNGEDFFPIFDPDGRGVVNAIQEVKIVGDHVFSFFEERPSTPIVMTSPPLSIYVWGKVKMWDWRTGECLCVFGEGSRFLVQTEQGGFKVVDKMLFLQEASRGSETSYKWRGITALTSWNIETGKYLHTFSSDSGTIEWFDVQGRHLYAQLFCGEVWVWDIHTGERLHVFKEHCSSPVEVHAVKVSGPTLVLGALTTQGERVFVWDIEKRELSHTFPANAPITCFEVQENLIYAGDEKGNLMTMDISSGKRQLRHTIFASTRLEAASIGQLKAMGSVLLLGVTPMPLVDNEVCYPEIWFWNLREGKFFRELSLHSRFLFSDGKLVAADGETRRVLHVYDFSE